jgi:hypothetical protein
MPTLYKERVGQFVRENPNSAGETIESLAAVFTLIIVLYSPKTAAMRGIIAA